MSDDCERPAGPKERAAASAFLCVSCCCEFVISLNSDHAKVMQRGVTAAADILNGLLNGLQLPRGSLVTVVDLLPNRCRAACMVRLRAASE